MTHAEWPELVVGQTGRMSKRRLFISSGPGARESALAASRVVWTMTSGQSRGLTTKMKKRASMSTPPSWRSPLCGSTAIHGACPVSAAGPGVKTFSSWRRG